MSAPSSFKGRVELLYSVFKQLGIDVARNKEFLPSDINIDAIRECSYYDEWKYYFENELYDFVMPDLSLFQFKYYNGDSHSYVFHEAPIEAVSYKQYLIRLGLTWAEVRLAFYEDYQTYLSSANLKLHVTPIRYDYEPDLYRHGSHPAAHLHIGRNSEIRLGVARKWNPVSFGLFVIRQMHPDKWILLHGLKGAPVYCKNIREHLPEIDAKYIGDLDRLEVRLL